MSFLKNLFGSSSSTKVSLSHSPTQDPTLPKNPNSDSNMIRVFDAYGREMFITRQQWRDNVLLGTIQNNWDDPEKLAGFIIQSLQDNFFDEMIRPAERLLQLEPDAERSTVLLAIVYLKVKRLKDSETVLQQFISKRGESGVVLTNLAKVYAERGNKEQMLQILWRGLELDPNQDNGLGWYEVIHREQGGEATGIEALRRVAEIPGSWRAQLWLARAKLREKDINGAIHLYQKSLAHAGKPVPTDLLMQMSGDLGNAGLLSEILQLAEPQFEPTIHGLQVGNNLVKAHFDLGQFDQARRILDQLFSLKRPDWKVTLGYWDTELAKAHIGNGKMAEQTSLSVTMQLVQGPIWLKPDSAAVDLFETKRSTNMTIAFLGCSAEVSNVSQHIQKQLADAPGRMSRALPLFLAEQMEFRCGVQTHTLVPWIMEPEGSFVLSGVSWRDEDAVRYAKQCEDKSEYIVVTHLITKTAPWKTVLRLVCTTDGHCVGQLSESFNPADPAQAIKQLSYGLLELLGRAADVRQQTAPKNYLVPNGPYFPQYLLRLEQLLAVRCAATGNSQSGFLSGEREIIDGTLELVLDMPMSINIRLLLAQTLLAMKRVRPDILSEFSERILLLQKEKPLTEPAQGTLQRLFDEAFLA